MRIDMSAAVPTVLLDSERRYRGWEEYKDHPEELATYDFEGDDCGDGIEASVYVDVTFGAADSEAKLDDVFLIDVVDFAVEALQVAVGMDTGDEWEGSPRRISWVTQPEFPGCRAVARLVDGGIVIDVDRPFAMRVLARYSTRQFAHDLTKIIDGYYGQLRQYGPALFDNVQHREVWDDFTARLEAAKARL